jgi:hypothetical protein
MNENEGTWLDHFIRLHKSAVERTKEIFGIDDYGIAWLAFLEGILVGMLIFWATS